MDPQYWPWFVGGSALAGIPLLHWLLLRRTLAVSGRITGLIDRWRHGPQDEPDMSDDELLAAMRAATAEAFGEDAVADAPEPQAAARKPSPTRRRQDAITHLLFMAALLLGGVVAAFLTGEPAAVSGLRSEGFERTFGSSPWLTPLVLVFGGMLVGFGTRMSGGCTSGHGLCGASRFQAGSLLATASFFGAGIAASFLLEVLW